MDMKRVIVPYSKYMYFKISVKSVWATGGYK